VTWSRTFNRRTLFWNVDWLLVPSSLGLVDRTKHRVFSALQLSSICFMQRPGCICKSWTSPWSSQSSLLSDQSGSRRLYRSDNFPDATRCPPGPQNDTQFRDSLRCWIPAVLPAIFLVELEASYIIARTIAGKGRVLNQTSSLWNGVAQVVNVGCRTFREQSVGACQAISSLRVVVTYFLRT
jgi:hypothetical protein